MKTTIYSTDDVINTLSEKTGTPAEQTRKIIDTLKSLITEYLKQATTDNNIVVRPLGKSFEITSKVIPDKKRILNGKPYTQTSRIKTNARFTRHYNRSVINEL